MVFQFFRARCARMRRDRRGVTAAEMALIAAVLALMLTVAGGSLAEMVSTAFSRVIGTVG